MRVFFENHLLQFFLLGQKNALKHNLYQLMRWFFLTFCFILNLFFLINNPCCYYPFL
jgi:hypothetical protein